MSYKNTIYERLRSIGSKIKFINRPPRNHTSMAMAVTTVSMHYSTVNPLKPTVAIWVQL